MRFLRALPSISLAALLSVAGCSCDDTLPAGTCVSQQDCPSDQVCVTGVCQPVGTQLDSGVPDDTGVHPDASAPDLGSADAGVADNGTFDSGAPDVGQPDTGSPDFGAADMGQPDLGPADLGTPDTGNNDRDGDGIPDGDDNCPDAPNPGQEDSDLDGQGDACDPPTTFRANGPSDPNCRYTPPPRAFTPSPEWLWIPGGTTPEPTKDQVMSTPAVVNLTDDNGDNNVNALDVPDVVFISFATTGPANLPLQHTLQAGIVRAVSGDTGDELWSATGTAREVAPASNVATGDLNGDGVPDVVTERWTGGVIALDGRNGNTLWTCTTGCTPITSFWGAIAIADLDGGGPEVLRGGCVLEGSTGVVRFCGTANQGHGSNGVGGLSVAADLDGDGTQEVITGRTAYRANGTTVWDVSTRTDGYVAVGNFDADTNPEFAMVGNSSVYRLDTDGTEIWSVPVNGGGAGGPPTIANFDSDPEPEIGVAGRTKYTVYDIATGAVVWANDIQEASSSRTGSSVFDFDGDGQEEVVYNDENTLFVYSYVSGPSAQVVWSTANPTLTAHEYPVIADVDNDGNAEIVVGANNFGRPTASLRGLRVFGDVMDNWVPTRPIWNQHSYHITNITSSGTVPYPEVRSWTNTNTYRTNVQGSGTTPALAAPDLVALDPIVLDGCPTEQRLGVWVENRGAILVPAFVNVAFYLGTPSAGNPAFANATTTRPLGPGDAELVSIDWANPPAAPQTVTVLVDDDGTGTDSGAHNECDVDQSNEVVFFNRGC